MTRRGGFDVVVVGAGAVGIAAALALARQGLRTALLEAKQPPPWNAAAPDLRVYALAEDSRRLLDELGVWDDIRSARAQAYRAMRIWDAAGGADIVFDADALGRPALGHIVEHGLLVDRLWRRAAGEAQIELFCPARLQQLEIEQAGVGVLLDDGRRLQARLVVGADGASSRVRQLGGLASQDHDYGQRAIVAYVRTAQPHQDTCWQRFLPSGPLAFLPCADGSSSIVWTAEEAEAERLLALADADFGHELTRAFDARLGAVAPVSQRVAFPLRRQLAGDMVQGAVLLIGDAAHVVHPLAGQGVNLGFRDVAALGELVAGAQRRGQDFAAAHRLQRWARARGSDNAMAAYSFEAINAVFSNDRLVPTLLRGPLLGMASRLPPLTQLLWKHASGA